MAKQKSTVMNLSTIEPSFGKNSRFSKTLNMVKKRKSLEESQ